MQKELASRIASLLSHPLPMKAQTERQLSLHLSEADADLASFLQSAGQVLDEAELEILFGPLFTPTVEQRAAVADLLYQWRPSAEQVQQVVGDVCRQLSHAIIQLPDGTEAKLALHEVLVDRFVRLLRLDRAPDAPTAAALHDVLPPHLRPIGMALLCEYGMTPRHQSWVVEFLSYTTGRRALSRGLLENLVRFIASQTQLEPAPLLAAAEALQRATESSAARAAGGHAYWSPDVAQHHQYRGEGRVDQARLEQEQTELVNMTALVEDLRSFQAEMTGTP